jgi:hypothetical protein
MKGFHMTRKLCAAAICLGAAPFLVIYNTDDDNAARETISDRLADIFDEVVAGGGVPSGGGATK